MGDSSLGYSNAYHTSSSALRSPARTSTGSAATLRSSVDLGASGGGGEGRKRRAEDAFAPSGLVRAGGTQSTVRSAVACTFCRKQKMKCEGPASKPCKRCRIAQVECIFDDPTAGQSKSTTKVRSNAQAQALLERRVEKVESRLKRLETMQGISDSSGTATATLTASPSPDPSPGSFTTHPLPPPSSTLPHPSSSALFGTSGETSSATLQNRVASLEAQVHALQGMLWQLLPLPGHGGPAFSAPCPSTGISPAFSTGLVLPASAQPTPPLPQHAQFYPSFSPSSAATASSLPPGSSAGSSLGPTSFALNSGTMTAPAPTPYWSQPAGPASFASFPTPLPPPPPLPDTSSPYLSRQIPPSAAPVPASPHGSAGSSAAGVPSSADSAFPVHSAQPQHYPPVFPYPSHTQHPPPPLYHPQPQLPPQGGFPLHALQQNQQQQGHSPRGLEALLGFQQQQQQGQVQGEESGGMYTGEVKREGQEG